jgi:hypothetical protein
MTEDEQDQLVAEQYAAGLENGKGIAGITIKQFRRELMRTAVRITCVG